MQNKDKLVISISDMELCEEIIGLAEEYSMLVDEFVCAGVQHLINDIGFIRSLRVRND